ncbi:galactose mutarotase [Puteibacter caeruleilacunae]|nr:galactose mutarotase [Puteibacter caeruleilacunae]
MQVQVSDFGLMPSNEQAQLFTLSNDNGLVVKITNYGGVITAVEMSDKDGNVDNVVLGFDKLEDYISDEYLNSYPYFGAICGRFANRIREGKFTLDGEDFQLAVNNGPNHLHGGLVGYDRVLWKAEVIREDEEVGVELSHLSKDGDEAYPGNVLLKVRYSLNEKNELKIRYNAETDKATPINLTNHSYFNLTGCKEIVTGHYLCIESDEITPVDNNMIPIGVYSGVAGTPFDFRTNRTIGEQMDELETGYDLNYVLRGEKGEMRKVACLSEQNSGREIEVYTTQPGMQLYTGYWIPELNGKFGSYSGVALETQHYPDSPNKPEFPETVLRPGETYLQTTVYKFGVKLSEGL